jgi:hypothetical protein
VIIERYEFCRYYSLASSKGFFCIKHQRNLKSCQWCKTCPKCDGLMDLEANMIINDARQENMYCTICGFRAKGEIIELEDIQIQAEPKITKCEVAGCTRNANPKCVYEGFNICMQHRGQPLTWKWRKFPEERFPLLVHEGKLIENPLYKGHCAPHSRRIFTKNCPVCEQEKLLSAFYRPASSKETERDEICSECILILGCYDHWPDWYKQRMFSSNGKKKSPPGKKKK